MKYHSKFATQEYIFIQRETQGEIIGRVYMGGKRILIRSQIEVKEDFKIIKAKNQR